MLEQDESTSGHPPARVLFVISDTPTPLTHALHGELSHVLGAHALLQTVSNAHAASQCDANIAAVVMCFSRHDLSTGLAELLDRAQALHIPILILTDTFAPSPALTSTCNTLSIHEPAPVIAGMLRGLLSRQIEIDTLREAALGAATQTDRLLVAVTRMQDELHLAGQVQREFLPKKLPSFSGGSVAALWRPMNYVSGDIYDVRRLDEHHVGLFIADAVGHGVPAALLTMVIARGLPSKEIKGNHYRIIQPSEALACVNRELLARQGNTTRFATAIYGIIDLRTRVMRMSVAGHPAAIVMRANQSMEIFPGHGGLIGVFDGVEWSEQEIQLHAGDRVILYSDGFEFAFVDPPHIKGFTRTTPTRAVQEFAALLSITEPADMIAHMERRLDEELLAHHNADGPADDLTMIAFKVV